jgi:hypothetical protein
MSDVQNPPPIKEGSRSQFLPKADPGALADLLGRPSPLMPEPPQASASPAATPQSSSAQPSAQETQG